MSSSFSASKKSKIYFKTDGHCAYCGEWQDPFSDWHIEHLIPKSKGGSNRIDNLAVACPTCNKRKGNLTVEEFRHYVFGKIARYINKAQIVLSQNHYVFGKRELRHINQHLEVMSLSLLKKSEQGHAKFFIDRLDLAYDPLEKPDFRSKTLTLAQKEIDRARAALRSNYQFITDADQMAVASDFAKLTDLLDQLAHQPETARVGLGEVL